MRQIIFFLTGAIFGAGGALLWLQKDYKKKLEALENRMNEQAEAAETATIAAQAAERIRFIFIIPPNH